jgi:hypothetical protein
VMYTDQMHIILVHWSEYQMAPILYVSASNFLIHHLFISCMMTLELN